MSGIKGKLVLTDPPYNTGMVKKEGATRLPHMFNDNYNDEEYHKLLKGSLTNYGEFLDKDTVLYIFLDWRRMHELIPIIKEKYSFSNLIVWDKVVHGLGSDYKYTYELIAVCKNGKPQLYTHHNKEYQDIWHIQREMGRNESHATAKPISVLSLPIKHATKEGDIVLDFFGGSGSTLIACEQLNRKCFMMELEPHYCSVIIERWEKLTGKTAVKLGE